MIKKLLFTSLLLANTLTATECTSNEDIMFTAASITMFGEEWRIEREIYVPRHSRGIETNLKLEDLAKLMNISNNIDLTLEKEWEYLKENGQFISLSRLRDGHIIKEERGIKDPEWLWSYSLDSMTFSVVNGSGKRPLEISRNSQLYIPKTHIETKYVKTHSKLHNFYLPSLDTDVIQINVTIAVQKYYNVEYYCNDPWCDCQFYKLHGHPEERRDITCSTFNVPVMDLVNFMQVDSSNFYLDIIDSNLVISRGKTYFGTIESVIDAISSSIEQQKKLEGRIIKRQQRIDFLRTTQDNLAHSALKKTRRLTKKLNWLHVLISENEKSLKREKRDFLNLKETNLEPVKIYQKKWA